MSRVFHFTHRDTKLGHWDVVWVDTEAHALFEVWCKAPRLWWALTFLLSGAPGKNTREGGFIRVLQIQVHAHTHIHAFGNLTRVYPRPPAGTWEKENVPLLPDTRSWTHLSYFLSGNTPATVPSELKPGLQGVGAVAFKTMVALYVEVEPVRWDWGRPRLCEAVLMTGIHGQCQMQVEMWTQSWIFLLLNTKPGLIREGGGDWIFCFVGRTSWLRFQTLYPDIMQGDSQWAYTVGEEGIWAAFHSHQSLAVEC